MIKLIKWQLREYRSGTFRGAMVLLLCAAVAAGLGYTLLQFPLDTVVAVFRYVKWLIFLVLIFTRYSDMEISRSTRDAGTLALHVPLPQWLGLLAKVLGLLPLLAGYIAINTLMFYHMPPDLPQLAELCPQRALFRATGPIFWSAAIINWLILRTRLAGVFLSSWRTRCLQHHPKLRSVLSVWLQWIANFTLMMPYLTLAFIFLQQLQATGFPIPLQGLTVATVGLLLTVANGYLLEYYTPQLEPWVD